MENENKLPEEFKAKWCAALRSGDYKQGNGSLKGDPNEGEDAEIGYCCLGVACVIEGYNLRYGKTPYITKDKKRIPSVLRGENKITMNLAAMNDDDCMTFAEIADYIEQNL